ncbi:hypothetical protein ACT3RT_13985 [Ewingella sp. AOP9-I1-14]
MTETTDINALMRPVRDRYDWSRAVWRDCDHCGKQHTGTVKAEDDSQICAHCADQLYWSAWQVLAEQALDQLEAERQRADEAESYARERDSENESIALTVGRLRTELAALLGTQEPVAYLTRHMGCRSPDDCEEYLEVSDKEGVSGNGETAIPVFTHPDKPVVVQEKVKPFKEVVPNDVVPVGNEWFRVRYITRHGNSTSLHLQRENEKLHPLRQNDVIHLSVDNIVPLMIVVKDDD